MLFQYLVCVHETVHTHRAVVVKTTQVDVCVNTCTCSGGVCESAHTYAHMYAGVVVILYAPNTHACCDYPTLFSLSSMLKYYVHLHVYVHVFPIRTCTCICTKLCDCEELLRPAIVLECGNTHTPGHPSTADEAWYWPKYILCIG